MADTTDKELIDYWEGVETDLSSFTHFTSLTAKYPRPETNFIQPALGIGGESGEILEKIKKHMRKFDDAPLPQELKDDLILEGGDVLYYLARLALVCGVTLQEMADRNKAKLIDRLKRDMIIGQGDHR